MKQQEFSGFKAIKNLGIILAKHNPRCIFLVTGKSSYEKSGAFKEIEPYLSGYTTVYFHNFETNPKFVDIQKGIKLFKNYLCDFVIAIGGGSVLDVAKTINILSANEGPPKEYITNKKSILNKGRPLIAIPTTAGSGSEATKFAVVYIDKTKYALEHEFIIPDYSIIDPQFTMSLPKDITATTGMDALSQAIESYWSVNSTDKSKRYSKEAIILITKYLSQAVNKPTKESREAMLKASNLAGKAINISKTTACHSIAYPLTSYFNIPHGHAVGLTLAKILVFNSQDAQGSHKINIDQICRILKVSDVNQAEKKIMLLMKEIGLETNLSKLNIKDGDINTIVDNVNVQRLFNNPREMNKEDLFSILESIR